jgi:hypothetical protein
MKQKHCYLFALEVAPLHVGDAYDELPLHCTLMHRFWSGLPVDELTDKVRSLFDKTPPIVLAAQKHTLLGPKQVAVSLIKPTEPLAALNMRLYELLNGLGVEYTAPQWVGKGHVFHVTDREQATLGVGQQHLSQAAYLIEVKVPGHDHQRFVRARFELAG